MQSLYRADEGGFYAKDHALQGIELLKFKYNEDGTLSEIQDRDGLKTKFNRDSAVLAYSIASPYGETTNLSYDSNDFLSSLTDPANRLHRFDYSEKGLITRIVDSKGNESKYAYDQLGLLLSDEDAAGFRQTMSRKPAVAYNEVNHVSPMGRTTTYTSKVDSKGTFTRSQIAADGTLTKYVQTANHDSRIDDATGMISTKLIQQDSRFGFAADIPLTTSFTTPGGIIARADYK